MREVRDISRAVDPHYTFLVVDAMTGQDAVATARAFHDTLALDGVIVTKLDGDARGGAALSVKEVVGRPIVFASTGEKLGDFDLFHPDRMADRILGMGDMLTLIEQAERTMDEEVVARSASRLLSGRFTLEDFLEQLQQVRKLGSLGGIMKLMPGMSKEVRAAADQIDDREVNRVEAIVRSMTPAERSEPAMVDGSRRLRIARGSGTSTQDVNQLLKQFKEMQKMMRGAGGPAGGMGRLGGLLGGRGGMAGLPGMGGPGGGELSELLSGVGGPSAGAGSADERFALPARSVRVPTQGGPKNKKKKGGRVTPPKAR
jgi:signal recognition particle subunit SRP54